MLGVELNQNRLLLTLQFHYLLFRKLSTAIAQVDNGGARTHNFQISTAIIGQRICQETGFL